MKTLEILRPDAEVGHQNQSAAVDLGARMRNTPILGGTAPRQAERTARKLAAFAIEHTHDIRCGPGVRRYLDVGCGNGFITQFVAPDFDEIVGIDMEHDRLEDFRAHAQSKTNLRILEMSAANIEFPEEFFSLLTAFEVLEHVADLSKAVEEMVRVCRAGGVLAVSVPQVWFPFENHGIRIGGATYERKIPLLPYLRPLHRKYALARVFSSAQIDGLFLSHGLQLLATAYASPQFERAGADNRSWESRLKFLRSALDRSETIPILRVFTGVSMLKAYRKP